jgi:hypothetical protein
MRNSFNTKISTDANKFGQWKEACGALFLFGKSVVSQKESVLYSDQFESIMIPTLM